MQQRKREPILLYSAPKALRVVVGIAALVVAIICIAGGFYLGYELIAADGHLPYLAGAGVIVLLGVGFLAVSNRLISGEGSWIHGGVFSPTVLRIIGAYLALRGAIEVFIPPYLLGEGALWLAASTACFVLARRRSKKDTISGGSD